MSGLMTDNMRTRCWIRDSEEEAVRVVVSISGAVLVAVAAAVLAEGLDVVESSVMAGMLVVDLALRGGVTEAWWDRESWRSCGAGEACVEPGGCRELRRRFRRAAWELTSVAKSISEPQVHVREQEKVIPEIALASSVAAVVGAVCGLIAEVMAMTLSELVNPSGRCGVAGGLLKDRVRRWCGVVVEADREGRVGVVATVVAPVAVAEGAAAMVVVVAAAAVAVGVLGLVLVFAFGLGENGSCVGATEGTLDVAEEKNTPCSEADFIARRSRAFMVSYLCLPTHSLIQLGMKRRCSLRRDKSTGLTTVPGVRVASGALAEREHARRSM